MSGHYRKRRALLPVNYSRFLFFVQSFHGRKTNHHVVWSGWQQECKHVSRIRLLTAGSLISSRNEAESERRNDKGLGRNMGEALTIVHIVLVSQALGSWGRADKRGEQEEKRGENEVEKGRAAFLASVPPSFFPTIVLTAFSRSLHGLSFVRSQGKTPAAIIIQIFTRHCTNVFPFITDFVLKGVSFFSFFCRSFVRTGTWASER